MGSRIALVTQGNQCDICWHTDRPTIVIEEHHRVTICEKCLIEHLKNQFPDITQ